MTKINRAHHDESFKLAFMSPEPMADLIRASIQKRWAYELDMQTLALVPTEHITETLRILRSDVIWSVKWHDRTVYIYVMLEFQSKPDRTMPLRMVEYVTALYRTLARARKIDQAGPYPAVYPLILYHGTPPWLIPQNINENLEPMPAGLYSYNLSLGYEVIDVRRWGDKLNADTQNVAEAMLRVQSRVRSKDVITEATSMLEMLRRTGRGNLWSAFGPWLRELLLQHFPRVKWPKRDSLEEVLTMLKSDAIEWQPEWYDPGVELGREEGLQQGVQQGLQQGVQQGLERGASAVREALNSLAQTRFGQPVATKVAALVANIDEVDKLAEVICWVNESSSGEALLARLTQK